MKKRRIIRQRSPNEMPKWFAEADDAALMNSGLARTTVRAYRQHLTILSNAVTAWNIEKMTKIVDELRRSGLAVNDQDLAHVWPLSRKHIATNGTYRFTPSPQKTNADKKLRLIR